MAVSIDPNAVMVMTCGDGVDRLDLAQHVEPVEVGHLHVRDDQVDAALAHAFDAAAPARAPPRPCSPPLPAPRARSRAWPRRPRRPGSSRAAAAARRERLGVLGDGGHAGSAMRMRASAQVQSLPIDPISARSALGRPRQARRRVAEALAHGRKTRNSAPARGRAVDLDPAVVVLDDAVADRQAEAGPLALVLGGEERLEDLLAVGGGDPRAACRRSTAPRTRRAAPDRARPCAAPRARSTRAACRPSGMAWMAFMSRLRQTCWI